MKLYSIKRLFYLSTSIKIHFFKTFILPYFDYCLSLSIYFPKSTFQSISNCFNLCLYRLFKLKPDLDYSKMENELEMMSEFLVKLQSCDLFTLQARIYDKLLTFSHSILLSENAHAILKEKLSTYIAKNDETVQATVQAFYELRMREKIKNIVPDTRFELSKTIGYF